MKIALLTDGIYPYVIGGMQKHSFYLAKYFAKRGVYVDLYHTNNSDYKIEELAFFTAEEKKFIRSFVVEFPSTVKLPGHYIRSSYVYSERVFKLFCKNSADADFVYAKGFVGWKLLEEKKKGFQCAKVGLNFHGYEMFQKAPNLKSKLEQYLLLKRPALANVKMADFLFSYGGKITDIIKSLGVPFSNIIEIPTGIEPEWVNQTNRDVHVPLKFVFVGRYERRKGIQELNGVLEKLAGQLFEMHFVGPIPEDKQLQLPQVRYWGSISDAARLRGILSSCDVLVCPSHSEGMPNVITEGMASGLAIIASDVGAVQALVTADNGILIEPGNVQSLETAMLRMLSMPTSELTSLKRNAVALIENHFLWDKIIDQTLSKIEGAIC